MLLVQTKDNIPKKIAVIEVLQNEHVFARYEDFNTIYEKDEDGVVLSNDGSVKETAEADTTEDIEQIRAAKLAEVSQRCKDVIFNGTDITLSDGSVQHISLKEEDQINLYGKQAQLAAGAEACEYHQDGQLCVFYSAADMSIMIETAMQFVSYHTTYCNSANAWIKGETDTEKIKAIQYGDTIPTKYQSEVLKKYIAATKA